MLWFYFQAVIYINLFIKCIPIGPDKCGNDHKLHFIFRHVNPLNGSIEEKHAKKTKEHIEEVFADKKPHLYKLIVRPDNTFSISVDHKVVNDGQDFIFYFFLRFIFAFTTYFPILRRSLLTDFAPPVNPEKMIDDPKDFKPETWDEREKIPGFFEHHMCIS